MIKHFHRKQIIDDVSYIGVVESAMMKVAYEVLDEDPATPGHQNRRATARSVFFAGNDRERFRELFAWRALNDASIEGQVFDMQTNTPTPKNINDAAIEAVIRAFWNVASNVDAAE